MSKAMPDSYSSWPWNPVASRPLLVVVLRLWGAIALIDDFLFWIAMALVGMALSLVGAVCGIIILIAAFKSSLRDGLLCFCTGIYTLYFVFAKFEHEKKGLIIAGWLGGGILGSILYQMGGGGM